jgi:hypothetical protein
MKRLKNFNSLFLIVLFIWAIFIVVFGMVLYKSSSICSTLDSVEMSVEVVPTLEGRPVLGFNADTDHLNFGKITSSISAKRTFFLNYSLDAKVTLVPIGTMVNWVSVTPLDLSVLRNTLYEIVVDLLVPLDAPAGNYTGKIEICYRDV